MMSFLPSALRNNRAVLTTVALCAATLSAHAGTINIVNGGFESTTLTKNSEFGTKYAGQAVNGWTSSGYNILFMNGTADSVAADTVYKTNDVRLAGPANGNNNGLTAGSPAGGNFVAMDGNFATGPLSQTISGFNAGDTVSVSFYFAASQQYGYVGANTESLLVSLGNQSLSTKSLTIAQQGFSGWQQATLDFQATGSSEVLSFLAQATPSGEPPFVLLDGVSATSTSPVPEPSSLALLGTGLAGLSGLVRRYSGKK